MRSTGIFQTHHTIPTGTDTEQVNRMHGFDAIVFDMDGLLLDTEQQYLDAMQVAVHELGFDVSFNVLLELVGHGHEESRQRLQTALGENFAMAEFTARWQQIWERTVAREGVAQKPGVAQMLEVVHEHGLGHAIATSTGNDRAHRTLELAGLAQAFPVRVTGDEVQHGKPAPDIYLEAAKRLSVAPERCLALEDSGPGLLAAHAAGMTAFLIPDLRQPTREVSQKAHAVVASLHVAATMIRRLL